MRRREIIITSPSDRQRLFEMTGYGKSVISKAMLFLANSLAARRMRAYAVNFLGCHVYLDESRVIK